MALRPRKRLFHPHISNRIQTAPTTLPLTLTEVKEHLRYTPDDQDTYLTNLITVAREFFEETTSVAIGTQTWKQTMDGWPRQREQWWDGALQMAVSELDGGDYLQTIYLQRFPLQSVSSITVYDTDGTSTAVTVSSTFNVDTENMPGRLRLKFGATWPIALRNINSVEIVYVAGYTTLPSPIKQALLQMIAHMFTHRGDCSMGDAYVKSGAKQIGDRYSRKTI